MPLYRWTSGAIAQIESTSLEPGKVEIVLRPRAGASAGSLGPLRDTLFAQGITSFIGSENGEDTLIIPDVKDVKPLLTILQQGGWAKGDPQVIATPADKSIAKENAQEKIAKNSLFLSALFYDLGNAAYIVSGIMRGKHNRDGKLTASDMSEAMVGVMMSVGDVLMTFYGKEKTKDPLVSFSDALSDHLAQHGVVVPKGKDATPEAIHKSGFFESANDFLAHHVTSVKCISETVAGGFMVKSATKPGNFNPGKLAAGLLLSVGWLSTFVLDKPHKPLFDFKPTRDPSAMGTGEKFYHWLGENPRGRIAGPLSMVNNFANLGGSWNEAVRFRADVAGARAGLIGKTGDALGVAQKELSYHQRKQYDFGWNISSSCSFLVANTLFGMSGKKVDRSEEYKHEFAQDIVDVAANVLMNAPEKARRYAVEETAEYITHIKGVTSTKEEVMKEILEHIEHIQRSAFSAPAAGAGASL